MEEFLSLCESQDGGGDSFVTAPSDLTVNRTGELTVLDSFMSARSIISTSSDSLSSASVSHLSSHHERTFMEQSIQSSIDELDRMRKQVISQARATVFDRDGTENKKENKSKSKTGPKFVDLDFNPGPTRNEPCTKKRTSPLNSDSSDDDMMENKKHLDDTGKKLRKQLKKLEREHLMKKESLGAYTSHQATKKNLKGTVLTGVVSQGCVAPTVFDSFFRLKIRNPKISSSTFESYIDGHKRFRISELKPTTIIKADSWTTAGVVVNRELRKSANGKDYLIWKLHDLNDCQQPPVTLLLFNEACKEYWKLQTGICVAVMTPMIADNNKNISAPHVTLKVFKPVQIVELGYSSDLGMCKGVKLDGQRCSNFTNVSLSDYCVHHVMKEVRKLSANRGTFNCATSYLPPKKATNGAFCNPHRSGIAGSTRTTGLIPPSQLNIIRPIELKTTTKAEEKATLEEIITDRANTFGARNMKHLTDSKKGGNGISDSKGNSKSMADFIRNQVATSTSPSLHAPKLGCGLCGEKNINLGLASLKERPVSSGDPARLRAISILKRARERSADKEKSTKRQRTSNFLESTEEGTDFHKRSKLSSLDNKVDLDVLMKRKSMHDSEADKAMSMLAQKHLDSLEAKEKVETFATECMSVKNVKVVSCKKCGYTSQRRSDLCLREGHCVTHGIAEKRFFKCGSCQKRTLVYSMMPTKPCKYCDANEWTRVAMKDERKVQLDNEKLAVRGEERKFVNS